MKSFLETQVEEIMTESHYTDLKEMIFDLAELEGAEVRPTMAEDIDNVGLRVIYEMIDSLEPEMLEKMFESIETHYGIDFDSDEDDFEDADLVEEIDEDENRLTPQKRRMLLLKQKKKKILGKKANSMQFKRNYYFDKAKRRFVKRDHAVDIKTLKKKTRLLKRMVKKASTKRKTMRTKKRFSHLNQQV